MKHKHLVVGAALSVLLFTNSVQAQSVFPDVPDNHWAAAAVKKLAEAGIVEGFPNAPVERVASSEAITTKIVVNAPSLITPRVKAALMNQTALANCTIDVDSFTPANANQVIVALRGIVQNAAQKKLAESIATESAPDARIINQLKIVAPKAVKFKIAKSKIAKSKTAKRQ